MPVVAHTVRRYSVDVEHAPPPHGGAGDDAGAAQRYKALYEAQMEENRGLREENAQLSAANRRVLQHITARLRFEGAHSDVAELLEEALGSAHLEIDDYVAGLERELAALKGGKKGRGGVRGGSPHRGFRPVSSCVRNSSAGGGRGGDCDAASDASCDSLGLVTFLQEECATAQRKIRRLEALVDRVHQPHPPVREASGAAVITKATRRSSPLRQTHQASLRAVERDRGGSCGDDGRAFHRSNDPDLCRLQSGALGGAGGAGSRDGSNSSGKEDREGCAGAKRDAAATGAPPSTLPTHLHPLRAARRSVSTYHPAPAAAPLRTRQHGPRATAKKRTATHPPQPAAASMTRSRSSQQSAGHRTRG